MLTRSSVDHPPVRHNQTLDFDGLRDEARAAFDTASKRDGLTQAALAEALGKTQPAISQALKLAGSKYSGLQREIVAHLTGFAVEPTFRVIRKTA